MRILAIDDDAECLESLLIALRPAPYECVVTTDPLSGLHLFQRNQFDVIISDLRMPRLSGTDLILNILEYNNEAKIIVMTAYDEEEELVDKVKNNIYAFFHKPIDFTQFLQTLQQLEQKNRHYAFPVHEIVAKKEVVIKPLDNKFRNLRGISAGTILQHYDIEEQELNNLKKIISFCEEEHKEHIEELSDTVPEEFRQSLIGKIMERTNALITTRLENCTLQNLMAALGYNHQGQGEKEHPDIELF